MIHLNIRSLRNTAHLIQLRELAISQKLDVITISETWLNLYSKSVLMAINYSDKIAPVSAAAEFVRLFAKTSKSPF